MPVLQPVPHVWSLLGLTCGTRMFDGRKWCVCLCIDQIRLIETLVRLMRLWCLLPPHVSLTSYFLPSCLHVL